MGKRGRQRKQKGQNIPNRVLEVLRAGILELPNQVRSGVSDVRILIIDDDEASQTALRHVLDSEGWKFKIQPMASETLNDLAGSEWTLVLVNVALVGLSGPLFATLRELALAQAIEEGKRRVRVLFIVPELMGEHAQPWLEHERLPYVLKPLNLHDFLEKVSDLLLENKAIPRPIRQVRAEIKGSERRVKERRKTQDRRLTPMFAAREDYPMSEEEVLAYEQQEAEASKKKRYQPVTDLGAPKKET